MCKTFFVQLELFHIPYVLFSKILPHLSIYFIDPIFFYSFAIICDSFRYLRYGLLRSQVSNNG
jgi:hypothetical protein